MRFISMKIIFLLKIVKMKLINFVINLQIQVNWEL